MKRVTINGNFRDFSTLEQALNFIRKNWNDRTFLADIREFTKNNLIQEQRRLNAEKQA